WIVPVEQAARALVDQTAVAGVSLLAEQHVAIERELAVLVARRPGGEAVAYPVVETVQRDGICHEVLAPARIAPELSAEAERLALRIASAVDVVGILAVELFVVGEGLVVNEIATRPHNSGHFSIEGCQTSQFENHLRAILDWPLGLTGLVAPAAVMANVIAGPETRDLSANLPAALEVPGVRVHLYGKAPRPARKVGHVTALGEDLDAARERAKAAAAILRGSQS
ncbi:MAG: ATP-grasp domain-containing protein, partial [Chloroflexi bacterium]|nr:ATP-grasp domain-containing protein [Chloroflexota bacterium]